MLADGSTPRALGLLAPDVIAESHSRTAILEFILEQLPLWRDRPDRPIRTNETALTSQLCGHLNGVARKTPGWDCLQFRVEEADETYASRKLDLIVAPAGETLMVQGRSYCDFEAILPIECKRLPTPAGSGRDEREYVATVTGIAGGIQRYKEGKHGAVHASAALIAYVQDQSFDHWLTVIGGWIRDLYTAGIPGWSAADALVRQKQDDDAGIATHESIHSRVGLPAICLRHLWVRMAS